MSRFIGNGGIPADTNPPQPDNGKQWVDTSQSPPEVKIYDSATQAWLPADTNETVVSQTQPTPEIGKLWFEPVNGGANLYAASSTSWEFVKLLEISPPDGAKLFRRFEANDITLSDGATVSNGDWVDTEASDGLTANGDPTFKTGVINGQDVVRTDGGGDNLTTTYSSVSQPFEVVVIGQFVSVSTSGNEVIVDDESSSVFGDHRLQNRSGSYDIYSGSRNATGGSTDTDPHLHQTIWRPSGGTDELYLDGSQLLSGDTGDQPSNGLLLGIRADGNNPSNFDFSEVLVYTDELTSSEQTELENYASKKYGISI